MGEKVMLEFKWVTREQSTPNQKPKVYFSCHKEDFVYFDDVCKDILLKQDCAIYYYDDFNELDDENLKEYEFLLSNIDLFVFVVTEKFLTTANRSLDFDFKFAKKHKIPVLPLMYEQNLAQKFSEKCGKLQYLNKLKTDETAISYNKKLTDFLNNTLISGELAKKVREAFDKHIFLSYRKKK